MRNDRQFHPQHELVVQVDAELADLMPQYLSNRWVDLREMRRCQAEQRLRDIGAIAHRIRGTAASYGFVGLGEIASELEQAAGRSDDCVIDRVLDDYDRYMRTVVITYV